MSKEKKKDSITKHCRCHYGTQDEETKETPGKEIHPFYPLISGNTHPRYEGPRDHPRLIMHVKSHLLSWLANVDTQPLIDQDLLNLQKYIVAYACKGASSTEELCSIYKNLVQTANPTASVKSIAQKLLMKIAQMVDVPAAAVDFINTGGKLYHNTRHIQRVGLSGYRPLNKTVNGDNATNETVLDKFLSEERRKINPNQTLWDWSKECRCRTKCSKEHVPVFTGGRIKPVWPLTEECCKFNLMIFSKGTWTKVDDLKNGYDTYVESFCEFIDSEECPKALQEVIALSKKRYDATLKKKKSVERTDEKSSQNTNSYTGSQESFNSQDSFAENIKLGHALLNDIALTKKEQFENICEEEKPLYDGGADFDWHEYSIKSLGFPWEHDDVANWLEGKSNELEQITIQRGNELNLPSINLRMANPVQRVVIAINILKFLEVVEKGIGNVEPLRLLVQGTAGTGKSFLITAISTLARRMFRKNNAVMNLAPSGSAANLLPDGRTVHSTLPPLRKIKKQDRNTAQLSDYPMNNKALLKLRNLISYDNGSHQLICLNMDERSMFSHSLLAWSSQRLCEATNQNEFSFGNVPVVNFFGDLGQLGPVGAKDLHVQPSKSSPPDELTGYAIYRQFEDCIVLTQTMRQKPDQKELLDRLLRIRSGTITHQDWLDINA